MSLFKLTPKVSSFISVKGSLFSFFTFLLHRQQAGQEYKVAKVVRLMQTAFILSFLVPAAVFSQQTIGNFPNIDGGFENQASSGTAAFGNTPFTSTKSSYTEDDANTTATFKSTGGRSGPHYLSVTTSNSGEGFYTPSAALAENTSYVVQYFYKYTGTNNRSFLVAASPNGGANFGNNSNSNNVSSVSSWTKRTEVINTGNLSWWDFNANNYGTVRFNSSGGGISTAFDLDDIVVYAGTSADVTAPSAPASAVISNASATSQNISWTAPSGGVDGGGYVVVRYTSSPGANDPNQNGIYEVGSTVAGTPAGQVVYIGTSTNFVSGSLTAGSTYYYKIYTVDKAFNYSAELTTSLSVSCLSNNQLDYTNGLHGVLCTTSSENGTGTLTAPAGTLFVTVGFASYGNPSGTCPSFTMGSCHAATSQSVAESYLLGNNTGSVPATNAVFGDPCSGTTKSLYLSATYTQSICAGSSPGTISGTTPAGGNGTYTYYWEKSTTSSSAGFSAASGTNNAKDYAPGALTQTTWYRRTVTSNGCTSISSVILVMVTPAANAAIAYSGSPYCSASGSATVTRTGTASGAYTSTSGLSINSGTGTVNLTASTPGSYVVTYTIAAAGSCPAYITTAPVIVGSPSPNALRFDGVNDYLTIPNPVNQTGFTLETWIKTSAASGTGSWAWQGNALFWGDVNGSANDFILSILNNKLAFDDGSANVTTTGSISLNDGLWHHVAVVRTAGSPGTVKLYVDGVQDGVTGTGGTAVLSESPAIYIGGYLNGNYFNGYMDEVRIWNVARTATQVSANRYINLAGNETGLSSYLRLDEGIGSDAANSVSGQTGGTLTNMVTAAATGSVSSSGWVTAGFSYSGSPYCGNAGTATITLFSNYAAGTFSATPAGLSLNTSTGAVNLSASTAGTYTVTNTTAGYASCAEKSTATITVTAAASATINYAGSPYCSSAGTATVTRTGTAGGAYSSSAGLSIDATTGTVNLAASTAGTYTVTYTVAAASPCVQYQTTASVTITTQPYASGSYPGNPYCSNAGTAIPTGTSAGAPGAFSSAAGLSLDANYGTVNLGASTGGTYTVTYTVPASGGCALYTSTSAITINTAGTWTGASNNSWNLVTNWQCGMIPASTTNVVIPAAVPNYPVINSTTTGMANNITIQSGATITITNGTLQIKGAVTATGAGILATAGKVEFNGTAAQTIPAGLFSFNTVKDLVITNAADVSLAGPLRVTNTVDFGNVDNSILFSNGYLTLVSTSSNSANLTDVTNGGANTGNSVSGNVTVERYVQGRRAYRFLTSPLNSTTSIKTNWMEGVNNTSTVANINPNPNYGTQITGAGGSANGFDISSTNNPSLFSFNIASQSWPAAANTSGLFSAGTGFRIMVRGSRSVNLNDNYAASSATTLRATGTLFTGPATFTKAGGGGTAGMPALSSVTGAYSFIANPYASSVDWVKIVINNFTNLSPTMYVFDPTITGSSNRGGYVSYNGILKVKNILSSQISNDLQSGQAIFVQTTGPNPSLTFQESYKSATFLAVFRTADEVPHINVELLLPDQVNTPASADGTAVYFSDDYSNSIGDDDSYKFTNQDENIAIVRNGTTLSLEGRKPVMGSDSVPLKMWQLTLKSYTLKITLDKFADNVEAYLEDKFLNTTIPLANGETLVPFGITADGASAAADRFKIVFETLATLPVRLTGIKAYEKNKGVQIDWVAESESGMELYEIEKSADAQNFKTIASVKAKNNPGVSTAYNGFDISPFAGDNYYRIKSIDKSGEVKESEVVRVNIANDKNTISVTNNPVSGNSIKILFNNAEKGNYAVSLINAAGEKLYTGKIAYSGGTVYQQVNIKSYLPAGVYQLQLFNGASVKNIQILVQ